jgi:hypothetical protein
LWIAAYVLVTLLNQIALKWASAQGVSTAQALIVRGAVCSLLAIAVATGLGEAILPKHIKHQFIRFINAGFVLAALMASYHFISATSVSLISRMDIPIMVVAATSLGCNSNTFQRVLAYCTLGLTGLFIFVSSHNESTFGYFLAISGVVANVIGYVFLQTSVNSESPAVVALVPGIASVVFGLSIGIATKVSIVWSAKENGVLVCTGVAMYLMYKISIGLYKSLSLIGAQYPTILIPALSMPLEAWIMNRSFDAIYVLLTMIIMALLTGVLAAGRNNHESRQI